MNSKCYVGKIVNGLANVVSYAKVNDEGKTFMETVTVSKNKTNEQCVNSRMNDKDGVAYTLGLATQIAKQSKELCD